MGHDLNTQLVNHIKGAHAMEANVSRMLDGMIATTHDTEVRAELEHHKEETERHKRLLAERLQYYGEETSTVKEFAGQAGAFMKGLSDHARSEKPIKNARDGFVIEHLEIATYELLERFAKAAGDDETAQVAKRNRSDEEAMAKKIGKQWDKFVDQTIREEGLVPA